MTNTDSPQQDQKFSTVDGKRKKNLGDGSDLESKALISKTSIRIGGCLKMSAEDMTRTLELGIRELELFIERKQGIITQNLEPLKNSKNISVSTFANNLQSEVESLKMALLHRENALKWWKEVQKQLEGKGETKDE